MGQIKQLKISFSILSERFHDETLDVAIGRVLKRDHLGMRDSLRTLREIYDGVALLNEGYPILPSITPDVDAPNQELVEDFLISIKRRNWESTEDLYDKLDVIVIKMSEYVDDDNWKVIPSYLHIFRVVLDRIEELEKGDE